MATRKIFFPPNHRVGRLTVIRELQAKIPPCRKSVRMFLCLCDCGTKTIKAINNLRRTSKQVLSCGCLQKEIVGGLMRTHGLSNTTFHTVWENMKQRCNNPNYKQYKDYGGRGIKICDEWLDFKAFYKWAINSNYQEGLSIDRVNNNLGYSPDNCRWATAKQQVNNRRVNKPKGILV